MKNSKAKKIVILIPGKNARGGITNYYEHIKEHLPENVIYFTRGARNWPKRSGALSELIRMISDFWRFFWLLTRENVSIMQTTTAFYKNSILRDGGFLILARWFGVKRIVFFRGWNDAFVAKLSGPLYSFFKATFFKAHALIDLSQQNVDKLAEMGYNGKLYLETTLVGKELVKGINFDTLLESRLNKKQKTILFLSRLESFKGIYLLLETYQIIKAKYPDYRLVLAGDGGEEQQLKLIIKDQQIQDVSVPGFVSGKDKKMLFEEASIFVFLSEYEGMPNAVLEAMAFGLPVVTTNVGGISSVFENQHNGVLLQDRVVTEISEHIINVVENTDTYRSYSQNNYLKARESFWSDTVGKRMSQIFEDVLKEN